jgi:metalloendopeptidase OMA1, mitochondrial
MRGARRVSLLAPLLLVAACSTVPYTHRTQLVLLSQAEDMQLGAAAYQQVLKKAKIVHDPQITGVVQRVGERIARVADKPEYNWQFTVIDDATQVNAFALPGGKVAVYTGLFPIARDEAGLAAVLGHEVAHAIARHGAERMSQGLLLQIGAAGVAAATGGASPATQQAILQAYGLGSQLGVALPFSRSQEAEADHIGLILMAKAGYDPAAAIGLWERMEEASRGKSPPEWLSTHPAPSSREENIRGWLAEARTYYTNPIEPIPKLPAIASVARVARPAPRWRRTI